MGWLGPLPTPPGPPAIHIARWHNHGSLVKIAPVSYWSLMMPVIERFTLRKYSVHCPIRAFFPLGGPGPDPLGAPSWEQGKASWNAENVLTASLRVGYGVPGRARWGASGAL